MDIENQEKERDLLNKKLSDLDIFFEKFSLLDDQVYQDSVIPKRYKELMGLCISIITQCKECIVYHLRQCLNLHIKNEEVIEVIKLAVIGKGSVMLPYARYTLKVWEELNSTLTSDELK